MPLNDNVERVLGLNVDQCLCDVAKVIEATIEVGFDESKSLQDRAELQRSMLRLLPGILLSRAEDVEVLTDFANSVDAPAQAAFSRQHGTGEHPPSPE